MLVSSTPNKCDAISCFPYIAIWHITHPKVIANSQGITLKSLLEQYLALGLYR